MAAAGDSAYEGEFREIVYRHVEMIKEVMPPNAETTTITGSLADSTILFTLKMLFTEPTDVPPNFITFMKILI